MTLRKRSHTQVPIWIKLRHLPVELWTLDGLSTVASGVGRSLYPDAITRAGTRLDYARVCVLIDFSSILPKHLIILAPDEDGGEHPCRVDIEYEWVSKNVCIVERWGIRLLNVLPRRRLLGLWSPCLSKSHSPQLKPGCQLSVWTLPRSKLCRGVLTGLLPWMIVPGRQPLRWTPMIRAGSWNVRGLNHRDHQTAVRDLISEFRLLFVGLLETRVAAQHVSQVQEAVLQHWKWFNAPNESGNRIWLTWDDSEINVVILEVHEQCIHSRVCMKCTLDACLITVVYGSNDVANRRGLWGNLVSIMETVDDVSWMVMGDFNTVLDYSEVCGASGDIGTAMEEFRSCVVDMGLLPVPLQGAVFTWHNCSIGPRSLWKSLDRMLANDSWFTHWPDSVCLSSTPRTSDHSPLILRGHAMHRSGRLFRFDNFLAAVPGFLDVVNNVWWHTIVGGNVCGH
ncbi:UNVERIFIED_CONTAM: hypothetical protein Slati_2451700 [Sesamum latifolium]|uniref:DUF4283 domain-containing protein n=1 Tax=Sesamum latifolium TaxID=2727402 RepID=A0AAW2WDE6_9LAMI